MSQSEVDLMVCDQQPVGNDVVQSQNSRFVPLTRFDEAFLLLRHRLGLKVSPQLLVELVNPGAVSALLDDKHLHEDRGAGVKSMGRSGSDVSLAFEVGRKLHRFSPVTLADIGLTGATLRNRLPA